MAYLLHKIPMGLFLMTYAPGLTRENTDWLFNFLFLNSPWLRLSCFFAKNIQKGFILMHLIVWYLKITNRAILSMTTDDCSKSGRVRTKSCLTRQCDWHLSVSNFKPEKGHVNKSFNNVYAFLITLSSPLLKPNQRTLGVTTEFG